MKRISLFIFCLCYFSYSYSQTFRWLKTQNFSTENDSNGVSTDAEGNVYTAGEYAAYPYQENGPTGMFVSKYDSNGNLLWTDTSNTRFVHCIGIVSDANGYSYVLANIASSVLIGNFNIEHVSPPLANAIIIKYDPNGIVQWVHQIYKCSPTAITTDYQGNTYIIGIYSDTVDFGNGNILNYGGQFLAKYNSIGNSVWVTRVGATTEANVLTYNYHGNIYLAASDNIKKYDLNGNLLSSMPADGRIIADNNGNIFISNGYSITKRNNLGIDQWTIPIQSNNYINLCVDSSGSLFSSSSFGEAFFNGGVTITKYDSNGIPLWDYSHETGFLGGLIYSDGNGGVYIASRAVGGAMVLKVSDKQVSTDIQSENKELGLSVVPNPASSTIFISSNVIASGNVVLIITDTKGKKVVEKKVAISNGKLSESIDLSNQPKGIYFIEVISGNEKYIKRVVLN